MMQKYTSSQSQKSLLALLLLAKMQQSNSFSQQDYQQVSRRQISRVPVRTYQSGNQIVTEIKITYEITKKLKESAIQKQKQKNLQNLLLFLQAIKPQNSQLNYEKIQDQKKKKYDFPLQKIKKILPLQISSQLETLVDKYQINTPEKMAHFLSQCAHQSNDFKLRTESLRYKSAKRICQIFPRYFKEEKQAFPFVDRPQKLANKVYSNRNGNGNQMSGDGFKYIGRGFIQLTGKHNYQSFANFIKNNAILSNPQLVAEKYALQSAAFYWKQIGQCNKIASKGPDQETIKAVTKKVNGGTTGLQDRIEKFKKFYNLLKVEDKLQKQIKR